MYHCLPEISATKLPTEALIPPGWHYPEITRAKVCINGQEFVSAPFEEREWKPSLQTM